MLKVKENNKYIGKNSQNHKANMKNYIFFYIKILYLAIVNNNYTYYIINNTIYI